MKSTMLILCFAMSVLMASSQESFNKDSKLLSFNVGLGSPYWSSVLKSDLPINPGIQYEQGITDNISVGGSLSYSSATYKPYNLKYNAYFVCGRSAWHFKSNEKLDPYVGASAGYVVVSVSSGDYHASASSGIGYGAFAGIRYYPSGRLGVQAELGYSSFSFLNAGVTLKL